MPGTDFVAHIVDVDIKWKLSMAVNSNDVRNINEPMITMLLVTTDESGNKVSRAVEMNLIKFREMLATLNEVHTQMENAKAV